MDSSVAGEVPVDDVELAEAVQVALQEDSTGGAGRVGGGAPTAVGHEAQVIVDRRTVDGHAATTAAGCRRSCRSVERAYSGGTQIPGMLAANGCLPTVVSARASLAVD